jgi:hypothetical protein
VSVEHVQSRIVRSIAPPDTKSIKLSKLGDQQRRTFRLGYVIVNDNFSQYPSPCDASSAIFRYYPSALFEKARTTIPQIRQSAGRWLVHPYISPIDATGILQLNY